MNSRYIHRCNLSRFPCVFIPQSQQNENTTNNLSCVCFLSLPPLVSCRPLYQTNSHDISILSFLLAFFFFCFAYLYRLLGARISSHYTFTFLLCQSFCAISFLSHSNILDVVNADLMFSFFDEHFFLSFFIRQPIHLYFTLFTHPLLLRYSKIYEISSSSSSSNPVTLFLLQMLKLLLTRNFLQLTSKRLFSLTQPVGLKRSNFYPLIEVQMHQIFVF